MQTFATCVTLIDAQISSLFGALSIVREITVGFRIGPIETSAAWEAEAQSDGTVVSRTFLKRIGRWDDTIIIFTSDHGYHLASMRFGAR